MIELSIAGEQLALLPERAVFWKRKQMLILSDLHLGKAGHFRKHGIPISRKIHLSDLKALEQLILTHQVAQVVLLGDLFHSDENNEWMDFVQFIRIFDHIQFVLVRGNHDILAAYPSQLKVVEALEISPFCFTHQKEPSEGFNISGHIHPGYRLNGNARQGITLPCFYFSKRHAILPAFGRFTGIQKIRVHKGDRVFGIADHQVIELI